MRSEPRDWQRADLTSLDSGTSMCSRTWKESSTAFVQNWDCDNLILLEMARPRDPHPALPTRGRKTSPPRPRFSGALKSESRGLGILAYPHAVGRDHKGRRVDRFEGGGRNPLQLRDQPVGPALVGGALEEPGGSIVGKDEAVALHRVEHRLGVAPERRVDYVGRPEPEARAHRRVGWIVDRAGLV